MSIPGSDKPLLALGAMATVGGLFALVLLAFVTLSGWAERELGAYPFKDEDWLRYLLSAQYGDTDASRIMLTGPSTARENLRVERFQGAFADQIILQGGISLATIEDTTLGLEYVEKVYGRDVLPDILVLGISPRFIAGIPKTRPFRLGLDLYSPRFRVNESDKGLELIAKGPVDGAISAVRFLGKKQPERFRVALFATVHNWLSRSPAVLGALDAFRGSDLARRVNRARGFDRPLAGSYLDGLAHRFSPYKYTRFTPVEPDWLYNNLIESADTSWWQLVFTWDAKADRKARARLTSLLEFTDRNNIRLLIVNMPERKMARDLYRTEYQDYLDLVKEVTGDTPFVDLREFLATEEFYDAEHSTVAGSRRFTDYVIALVRPMIDGE